MKFSFAVILLASVASGRYVRRQQKPLTEETAPAETVSFAVDTSADTAKGTASTGAAVRKNKYVRRQAVDVDGQQNRGESLWSSVLAQFKSTTDKADKADATTVRKNKYVRRQSIDVDVDGKSSQPTFGDRVFAQIAEVKAAVTKKSDKQDPATPVRRLVRRQSDAAARNAVAVEATADGKSSEPTFGDRVFAQFAEMKAAATKKQDPATPVRRLVRRQSDAVARKAIAVEATA